MTEIAIVKRSVRIAGHATSVSLEMEFWQAFQAIAERRRVAANELLAAIDAARRGNLSSAIRLFVLDCCRRGELDGWMPPAGASAPAQRPPPSMRRPRRAQSRRGSP